MKAETDPISPPNAARPSRVGAPSRRRFVGAAGGLGVLLAVQARSALGQGVCESPSAMMSGNTSPREGDVTACAGGFSPGFWKQPQHEDLWTTAGATFPQIDTTPGECSNGQSAISTERIADRGTLVGAVFEHAPSDCAEAGMWEVLAYPGNYDDGQLMRHLICAWLNAGAVPGYPIPQQQVVAMQTQLVSPGYYCPAGVQCTGGTGMSADDVIRYIEGMYDLDSYYEHDLCVSTTPSGQEPGTIPPKTTRGG